MTFKPCDIVIYDYNGFKYKLKLSKKVKTVASGYTTKVYWSAYFLKSLSDKSNYYKTNELSRFPEEYMTLYNPTKLERALV